MVKVQASEFSKNFGHYREIAQREAVAVTNHNRITGYFVSAVEYDEYLKVKAMTTKAYAVSELSEDTLLAIANSQMDSKYDHLNKLLED